MGPPRISLAGMLGVVAVIAIGLASLVSATVFWTSAASTVTLAVLLGALVGTMLLRGPERAYAVGFATFGWAYLLLVNWSWIGAQFGHDLTGGLGDLAESLFPTEPEPPSAAPGRAPTTASLTWMEHSLQRNIKIGNFVQIFRLTMTLLFALLGGFVALGFFDRSQAARKDDTPGATGH
jgi:hypothetical protein